MWYIHDKNVKFFYLSILPLFESYKVSKEKCPVNDGFVATRAILI